MAIEVLNIPVTGFIKEGDTIPELEFVFDTGVDLTTSTIKMQIYDGNTKILDVTNGSGITVVNALQFNIDQIEAADNPFRHGEWLGDLEITDADGVRTTYHDVKYTVIKQYTK